MLIEHISRYTILLVRNTKLSIENVHIEESSQVIVPTKCSERFNVTVTG